MRQHGFTALVFVAFVVLGTAIPASAAMNLFMDIEGVQGESTDENHMNWIEILSFSHGVSRPTCDASLNHSEYVFAKYVDSATDDLYDLADRRVVIPQVTVEVAHASAEGTVFYDYEFQDVILISGAVSAIKGDLLPLESWSLSYGQVRIRYRIVDVGPPDVWQEVIMTVGPCIPH